LGGFWKVLRFFITGILLPASRRRDCGVGQILCGQASRFTAGLLRMGDLTVWFSNCDAKRLSKRHFELHPEDNFVFHIMAPRNAVAVPLFSKPKHNKWIKRGISL
jgi:hypothetical protein